MSADHICQCDHGLTREQLAVAAIVCAWGICIWAVVYVARTFFKSERPFRHG